MKIIKTGVGLADHFVPNELLCPSVGSDAKWVSSNLGINSRRFLVEKTILDIAEEAGRQASVNPDMIIVATCTHFAHAPSLSCMVAGRLGVKAVCFDINAVCSGFLYALVLAEGNGNVLVIGVDRFSDIIDFGRRDAVYFGDGAGACMVTKGNQLIDYKLYSDNTNNGFHAYVGGSFQMDGQKVYETATTVLPNAINDILKKNNLSINEIDYLLPHQPGINILKKTAEKIGLPFNKVLTNMSEHANTSAGTIPILLHENFKRIQGKKVLMATVGAGWTWGVALFDFGR